MMRGRQGEGKFSVEQLVFGVKQGEDEGYGIRYTIYQFVAGNP
jgi:hypothetical protein